MQMDLLSDTRKDLWQKGTQRPMLIWIGHYTSLMYIMLFYMANSQRRCSWTFLLDIILLRLEQYASYEMHCMD
ncbi:unnamed protein product [Prunus armeniaca]